jgi:hypothetical protein
MHTSMLSFICGACDNVMIHFPRKKDVVLFQPLAQPGRGIEEQKSLEV